MKDKDPNPELLGAHTGGLDLKDSEVKAKVSLDSSPLKRVAKSLREATSERLPDRTYLRLENVTGDGDAHFIHVIVNDTHVGAESLFGLRGASRADGHHAGAGLTFVFDITDLLDELHLSGEGGLEAQKGLDVTIRTEHPVHSSAQIKVGRVSVYRESHQ